MNTFLRRTLIICGISGFACWVVAIALAAIDPHGKVPVWFFIWASLSFLPILGIGGWRILKFIFKEYW